MERIYCQSVKNPKLRFEVLHFDPDTKIGTLKGETGTEFTRNLSKPELSKYGYRIVKEDDDAKASARAQNKK